MTRLAFFIVLALWAGVGNAENKSADGELKSTEIETSISTVLPVVDGMLLTFNDTSYQRLRIRTKSFGPGFCRVDTRIDRKDDILSSPPGYWSGWQIIGPPFHGGTYALTFDPQCSTGALGEVLFRTNGTTGLDDQLSDSEGVFSASVTMAAGSSGTCTGNGCEFIEIRKKSGCIELHNVHNKPILVEPNAAFVTFDTIYARSKFVPMYGWGKEDMRCLSSYPYDYVAVIQ